jgi:mono/diheme cytochrome c family protein
MRALGRKAAAVAAVGVLACAAAAAQEMPAPPAGASEQVLSGARLYQQHCAVCHGPRGRDASVFPRPIWGPGHDIGKFGTAKGLFEYLQLLMPFDDPAKVDDAGKTAIVAYMLVRNGNVQANVSMPRGGDQTGIK